MKRIRFEVVDAYSGRDSAVLMLRDRDSDDFVVAWDLNNPRQKTARGSVELCFETSARRAFGNLVREART